MTVYPPSSPEVDGAVLQPQPARKPRRSSLLTIVTTSEIQTFRDCPQKHHFKYRERLRPLVEGRALAFGSIFHHGMSSGLLAGWKDIDGLTVDERLARQIEAAVANVDDEVTEYIAKVAKFARDANYIELEADAVTAADMLKFMLTHYFERSKRDLTSLVLVETEQRFAVPVRDKLGRRTKLRFDGVRDAVFYDPLYNCLELHEHKTVSSLPEDIGKRAEMDPQTSGYLYSLVEERRAGTLKFLDGTRVPDDVVIGRVAYNAVRKSRPRVPKINQDGSVSVAAIDTLATVYVAALDEQAKVRNIPVTEKQYALAASLAARGDTYFSRIEYQKTKAEVERWRSDTMVDSGRIRAANADPALRTRNPGHCNMPWSMKCEFRIPCLDDTPETRALFRVSDDPHPELREAEAAADAVTAT